jgi:hypothetical protein
MATFQNADRVRETTTTTSTGTYSLAGAVTGFRTFVAGIGTTNTCFYTVEDGTNWENGIGTVTSGTPDTLARTLILSSSNAGAAVNWGAGTKNVFCGPSATYADFNPKAVSLAADHTLSSVTGSAVSMPFNNVLPGTYIFQYYLLVQSATTTVSPMLGINFTGTAAVKAFRLRYPGTGTTAITGVADDVGANTGQIEESMEQNAFSTTTPNMGFTGGVATINTNILVMIEGLIIVTATGNLELWHGSETATATSVKAGSSAVLKQTN